MRLRAFGAIVCFFSERSGAAAPSERRLMISAVHGPSVRPSVRLFVRWRSIPAT